MGLLVTVVLLLWVTFVALMANVTAWAWNLVIFDLFHGPGPIDGWQGFAINILFSLLTGGTKLVVRRKEDG